MMDGALRLKLKKLANGGFVKNVINFMKIQINEERKMNCPNCGQEIEENLWDYLA
jgi:hypothetical protein